MANIRGIAERQNRKFRASAVTQIWRQNAVLIVEFAPRVLGGRVVMPDELERIPGPIPYHLRLR
jgi:hypothetical protein